MIIHIDGGAKGNPGPATAGFHVQGESGQIAGITIPLGIRTNNEAEYEGLLGALGWAVESGKTDVHIMSDSMLLVRQMQGAWQVKASNIKPLYAKAKALEAKLGSVSYEWIPREQNSKANKLANGK